jgi:DNA-binding protein HU-beta
MAEKKGMNRAELNEAVAKELGDSRAAADRAVDAVLNGIQKGLKKQGTVSLVGFGTFAVKKRKARMGRNPQTGEPLKIKASKSVGFKAGRPLKEGL